MITFKDMTFCAFDDACSKGEGCPRALTDEIVVAAKKWWGEDGAPISVFSGEPQCFEQIKERRN